MSLGVDREISAYNALLYLQYFPILSNTIHYHTCYLRNECFFWTLIIYLYPSFWLTLTQAIVSISCNFQGILNPLFIGKDGDDNFFNGILDEVEDHLIFIRPPVWLVFSDHELINFNSEINSQMLQRRSKSVFQTIMIFNGFIV